MTIKEIIEILSKYPSYYKVLVSLEAEAEGHEVMITSKIEHVPLIVEDIFVWDQLEETGEPYEEGEEKDDYIVLKNFKDN
jgi:nitrate reductase NapAB chaperone NapD